VHSLATTEIAKHCNEKKEAAKMAGFQSDNVFFCIYVKAMAEKGNPLCTEAMVLDLGAESFTLLLLRFGIDCRVHAVKDWHAKGVAANFAGSFSQAKEEKKSKGKPRKNTLNEVKSKDKKDSKGESKGNGLVSNIVITLPGGKKLDLRLGVHVQVFVKPASRNGRISFFTEYKDD